MTGSYYEKMGARMALLEANFASKSAFVADLNETAAGVGISVLALGLFGTAANLALTNAAVNKIKTCLVNHNLMVAA